VISLMVFFVIPICNWQGGDLTSTHTPSPNIAQSYYSPYEWGLGDIYYI
jgi:hypothetical protein